jgi:hypothetical protein
MQSGDGRLEIAYVNGQRPLSAEVGGSFAMSGALSTLWPIHFRNSLLQLLINKQTTLSSMQMKEIFTAVSKTAAVDFDMP